MTRHKEIKESWFWPTLQTFHGLKEFISLATPGVVMLMLENLNMNILVLMASLLKSSELLAAQVIVTTLAELFLMVPYGLSIGAVTLVGHSLGKNRPEESRANYHMIVKVSSMFAFLFGFSIIVIRKPLVKIYTDDDNVTNAAANALVIFSFAFFFDWTQCVMSGVIKAVRKQSIASVASLCCMALISMPGSYLIGVRSGIGIEGLWIGYGISSFFLAVFYFVILNKINWKEKADFASQNELSDGETLSESTSQERNQSPMQVKKLF